MYLYVISIIFHFELRLRLTQHFLKKHLSWITAKYCAKQTRKNNVYFKLNSYVKCFYILYILQFLQYDNKQTSLNQNVHCTHSNTDKLKYKWWRSEMKRGKYRMKRYQTHWKEIKLFSSMIIGFVVWFG